MKSYLDKRGQSLMEILIAIAVGVIMIGAAAVIIVPALKTNTEVNEEKVGAGLGRALFEKVRVFSEVSWTDLYNLPKGSSSVYYLTTSTIPFETATGTEYIQVSTTTYLRNFYIENACRWWSGDFNLLWDCTDTDPNVAIDPSTLKVVVNYSWDPENATNSFSAYLTKYRSSMLQETDWSAGWVLSRPPATSSDGIFATSSNIDFSTTSPGSIILDLNSG